MVPFLSPEQTKFRLGWLGVGLILLPLAIMAGTYLTIEVTGRWFPMTVIVRGWWFTCLFEPMAWVCYCLVVPVLLLRGIRTVWKRPLPWAWGKRAWALIPVRILLVLVCLIEIPAFLLAFHSCHLHP